MFSASRSCSPSLLCVQQSAGSETFVVQWSLFSETEDGQTHPAMKERMGGGPRDRYENVRVGYFCLELSLLQSHHLLSHHLLLSPHQWV